MRRLNQPDKPSYRVRTWQIAAFALMLSAQHGTGAAVLPSPGGEPTHFNDDNSDGSFYKRYVLQGEPGDVELVDDPMRARRKVFKITLRNRTGGEGQRTEVVPRGEYKREGKRWYAFSILFPENWQSTYDMVLFQLHTSQSISGWNVSPPFALVAVGPNLELHTHGSHLRPTDTVRVPSNVTKNLEKQVMQLGTVETNKWYCGVVMVDWRINPGQGSTHFWLNNKPRYSSNNVANNYESVHVQGLYSGGYIENGNYPKAGLYAPGSMTPGVPQVSVYQGFVYVGSDDSPADNHEMQEEMAGLTMCPP